MDPDRYYWLPNEPNLDEPLTPVLEANMMEEASGLVSARQWANHYMNEAVTSGDTVTASYWQAVIVRLNEVEASGDITVK